VFAARFLSGLVLTAFALSACATQDVARTVGVSSILPSSGTRSLHPGVGITTKFASMPDEIVPNLIQPGNGATILDIPWPGGYRGGYGAAAASDGSVWFASPAYHKLFEQLPNGTIQMFPCGTNPRELVFGPDGAVWFTG
jgi:streptogramin lyase